MAHRFAALPLASPTPFHVSVRLRVFLVMLIATFSVLVQDATPAAPPNGAKGNYSGSVDISGRTLHLTCHGEGIPTVIFESGSPFVASSAWDEVEAQVAEFTRVCRYDRANIGKSGAAPAPRTAQQMADDLAALLTASHVPAPYILVSTGFGTLVSRLYASEHPTKALGMLLIEPLHEDMEARWQSVLPPAFWSDRITSFWHGNPEQVEIDQSYAEVRQAAPLRDMPLTVIVHTSAPAGYVPDGWPIDQLDPIRLELASTLSTLAPRGRLIQAGYPNGILQDDPAAVTIAIRGLIWTEPNHYSGSHPAIGSHHPGFTLD